MSEKEAGIEVQGRVEESSGGMYRVKLDQGPTVLAYASGKMKRFHIRIITGDRVAVRPDARADHVPRQVSSGRGIRSSAPVGSLRRLQRFASVASISMSAALETSSSSPTAPGEVTPGQATSPRAFAACPEAGAGTASGVTPRPATY